MGAVASGGGIVLNEDVVRGLAIPSDVIEREAEREGRELLAADEQFYAEQAQPAGVPGSSARRGRVA
jgi:predicted phosphoribosyltransferase